MIYLKLSSVSADPSPRSFFVSIDWGWRGAREGRIGRRRLVRVGGRNGGGCCFGREKFMTEIIFWHMKKGASRRPCYRRHSLSLSLPTYTVFLGSATKTASEAEKKNWRMMKQIIVTVSQAKFLYLSRIILFTATRRLHGVWSSRSWIGNTVDKLQGPDHDQISIYM